jgi:hypothetical protein
LFLPTDCEFEQLSIKLTGNGDISGGTAAHATIMLTGNGDVSKLHVRKSGNILLNGNGDVNITREASAKVKKVCNGHGDVRIRTV